MQRVTTERRAVAAAEVVPAALPFFAPPTLLGAPPDGLEPPSSKAGDPLDWYATALD